MIWETQTLVTDDSAFGGITSALTFIKLTQRTGCAMNWSFGNQLQHQVARPLGGPWPRHPPLWASAVQGHFLQAGALGAERRRARRALGLDPPSPPGLPSSTTWGFLWERGNVSLLKSTETHLKTTKKDDYTPFGIIIIINTLEHLLYPGHCAEYFKFISHLIFFI